MMKGLREINSDTKTRAREESMIEPSIITYKAVAVTSPRALSGDLELNPTYDTYIPHLGFQTRFEDAVF